MFRTDKFEKLSKQAYKHIEKHEFVLAKNVLLECLSIKPNNIATLNNLAQVHSILNENDKARGYNEIVLEECNKQSDEMKKEELLIFKINALTSLKRKDETGEHIDELLKVSPDNLIGLFYKISYLEEKNQYRESLTYIDRILTHDPHNVEALLLKGRNLVELNEYEKAERFYNLVFEIDPKNKSAINLKSELLKKRFKTTLTPHDLMLKALQYWDMKDFESAESFFEKALDMNQKYDEIWFNQGELFIRRGKITKAIKSFEKAFELNPNSGGVANQKKLFRILKIMKIISKLLKCDE